ncbi:URC4/urg3 family protein [Pseudorhodoplanes sp.]|uniref:URC4/urg3 family protein n=1 Tax=Pseudorhodoplanes sp. TaxID=1934341 RepID=UPI003919D00D
MLTAAVDSLLSAKAVRERAHEMLTAAERGELANFTLDLKKLPATATFVAQVIRENYPVLQVPLHARWRHFRLGGIGLWPQIVAARRWTDPAAQARAAFDLAIVSVLLDAGAGPDWRYRDGVTGMQVSRSEGLAIASLRMFEAGYFSADPADPLRADARELAAFTADDLARGFQVSDHNPLTGLEGRAALIARLGKAVLGHPAVFATQDDARPGGLFDHLASIAGGEPLPAPEILRAVLLHMGPIWPGRIALDGVSLGDTWRHSAIVRSDETNGLIPFHKLSQWLTYSLIEPLQEGGVTVADLDGLTGLAEYRNGGLFLDAGVIALRDPAAAGQGHEVWSELVVEWRALTVALLDRIAPLVRHELQLDAADFPLGAVLEGGTWAAGRRLANQKRPGGSPPIHVISDGTVF